MFHHLTKWTVSLAIAALLVVALGVSLSPARAQSADAAQRAILDYYNAINRHEYQAAYQLWLNPAQTYDAFVNGFAQTDYVEPYTAALQLEAGSATLGRVPVVVLATMTDGRVSSYAGCFSLQQSGGAWRIVDGSLQTVADNAVPDATTIINYLSGNCFGPDPEFQPQFQDRSHPAYSALASYFHAINLRDFPTAYGMWLFPLATPDPDGAPAQDFRPAYSNFVSGYANTRYINVYMGNYVFGGAAAGRPYLNGMMPVVLVSTQADGSIQAFAGCYVMGTQPGSSSLGIVNGELAFSVNTVPTGAQIIQQLPADCTTLGISF